jgi:signal transduction histidine kinase
MLPSEPVVIRPIASQRLILLIGFGALLLLMGLGAYRASRTLTQIQTSNARIQQETDRRDDLLDRVRSNLFRSSIEVRDYLLDIDPSVEQSQRDDLQANRNETAAKLEEYKKHLEAEEVLSVGQLDGELNQYWKTLEPVFEWPSDYRREHGEAFLRDQVFPRRQTLLNLVDHIAAVDDQQLGAGEDSIAAVQRELHRQLTETSLLLIGIGLIVGVFSVGQTTRLERVAENQYRQVVQARSELRRLNARLVAAEEEERRKISRELHDQVGQHLSAVLIELGNVESALPRKDLEAQRRISSARRLAEASIAKVRDLALLLRPSMLDDLGLVAALRWNAREISRRTGVHVDIASDGASEELPSEFRTCIYRVVQEAMNNAVRHAAPTQIRVEIRQRPEEIHVAIQDDGSGFDPRQDQGLGLLGMKERIQGLGGILQIDSEPRGGTIVSVLLPLEQLVTAGKSA